MTDTEAPDTRGAAAERDLAVLAQAACGAAAAVQSGANVALLSGLLIGAVPIATAGAARGAALASTVLALLALLVWSWQCVLAARLALDSRVFQALAQPGSDALTPAGFDRALQTAGLRATTAPRDMAQRWQGARRLLVHQAVCLGALILAGAAQLALIGGSL